MRKPVILTNPYPTVEEIAALGGVSKSEMREIVALGERIYAEQNATGSTRSQNKKTLSKTRLAAKGSTVSGTASNSAKRNLKRSATKKRSR